jgi:uncharacterized protein with ATP-grasp and redox domains
MEVFYDCIPCLVRQALDASRMAGADEQAQESVLRGVLTVFAQTSFTQYPAQLGYIAHNIVKQGTGCSDPYRQMKIDYNELAQRMYPELKRTVQNSGNRLETAVRLAIAGNIIDFAIRDSETVYKAIKEVLDKPFAVNHFEDFKNAVEEAKKILYIGDNAGEIIFDKVLIESLPTEKITLAVKGGPIINDATMDDADFAGLTGLVTVISTGSDTPGTLIRLCSPEFRELFDQADLVISKGQENYETLRFSRHNIYFLLRVKCPTIARDTGQPIGNIIIQKA